MHVVFKYHPCFMLVAVFDVFFTLLPLSPSPLALLRILTLFFTAVSASSAFFALR